MYIYGYIRFLLKINEMTHYATGRRAKYLCLSLISIEK